MNISRFMVITVLAGSFATSSHAGNGGYVDGGYLGASIGQAEYDDTCNALFSCDDDDTGWKLFVGRQINKNFGLELDYVNLGEASAKLGGIKLTTEAQGVTFSGIGSIPVGNQWSVFAKAGLMYYDAEAKALGFSKDNKDFTYTYGVGGQYNINKSFGIRAEWQMYKDLEAVDNEEFDASLLSIGGVFWF